MDEDVVVLVVCEKSKAASLIADNLSRHGMLGVAAVDANDAFDRLKKQPADMVIAESHLFNASGLDFLAACRKQFPLCQRVILCNRAIEKDLEEVVNLVGPSAICHESIDPRTIWRLLVFESAVRHSDSKAAGDRRLEVNDLRQRVKELENENHLLSREMERFQQGGNQRTSASGATQMASTAEPGTAGRNDGPPDGGDGSGADASAIAAESTPGPETGEQAAPDEEMSPIALSLSQTIQALMEKPDITLPVMPAVGLKVQEMLSDDACNFQKLAELVQVEQGMSARILQVANSSSYAGLEKISSIQHAVTRLGLQQTRNILQAVIAENLFKTRSGLLKKSMARLWMHSLCTAYSNEHIAMTLRVPEADNYFMMGLLHDVGKLAVIHLIQEGVARSDIDVAVLTDEAICAVMNHHHRELGLKLVRSWYYSATFQNVVKYHNDNSEFLKHGEPVIIMYFSNLLVRKLGYSLVPYSEDLLMRKDLSESLNISPGRLLTIEQHVSKSIEEIKKTYFSGGKG